MLALPTCPAVDQLVASGYHGRIASCRLEGEGVRGRMDPATVRLLEHDPRFAAGAFFAFHRDVGDDLIDFRSYNGTLGQGSLQLVIDRRTGEYYADVDRANPYQDVVHFIWHAFGEVVPQAVAGWWRRLRGKP